MANVKKTIIITGASSGLGAELAIKYSASGNNLFLIARSEERLNKVSEKCRSNGANVISIIADVTDADSMNSHINEIADKYKIDIVVACAGVSAGTLDGPETAKQTNKIFATNINGVLNTILPAVPHMIRLRSGNIVIVSSMAGFLGLSSAPSYSASKGAARIFGQALQGYLKSYNVHVSTVIPGYIKTPMTEVNSFPMPFMTSADKAARKIVR
ncbi:MAG: SDR family NAD(P)-dependent oxidoreductase, partial [Pseudomonadota bacterium]